MLCISSISNRTGCTSCGGHEVKMQRGRAERSGTFWDFANEISNMTMDGRMLFCPEYNLAPKYLWINETWSELLRFKFRSKRRRTSPGDFNAMRRNEPFHSFIDFSSLSLSWAVGNVICTWIPVYILWICFCVSMSLLSVDVCRIDLYVEFAGCVTDTASYKLQTKQNFNRIGDGKEKLKDAEPVTVLACSIHWWVWFNALLCNVTRRKHKTIFTNSDRNWSIDMDAMYARSTKIARYRVARSLCSNFAFNDMRNFIT